MKKPDIPLGKLLEKTAKDPNRIKSGPRCFVCSEPLVNAEVDKFYKLREAGNQEALAMSWMAFWKLHLRGQMEWHGSYSSLMNHVRNHLGV